MARSSARPLSPYLGIYKWGPHMAVSILNRAMGVGLATVGMAALVWWLVAAATGKEAYDLFMSWASWWPGKVVAVALTFTFFLHLCAGLRHFVPSKLSVFTAPAAAARGVKRVARRKASSLKGTVTFMPRPPAVTNSRTVVTKPSSGASSAA